MGFDGMDSEQTASDELIGGELVRDASFIDGWAGDEYDEAGLFEPSEVKRRRKQRESRAIERKLRVIAFKEIQAKETGHRNRWWSYTPYFGPLSDDLRQLHEQQGQMYLPGDRQPRLRHKKKDRKGLSQEQELRYWVKHWSSRCYELKSLDPGDPSNKRPLVFAETPRRQRRRRFEAAKWGPNNRPDQVDDCDGRPELPTLEQDEEINSVLTFIGQRLITPAMLHLSFQGVNQGADISIAAISPSSFLATGIRALNFATMLMHGDSPKDAAESLKLRKHGQKRVANKLRRLLAEHYFVNISA